MKWYKRSEIKSLYCLVRLRRDEERVHVSLCLCSLSRVICGNALSLILLPAVLPHVPPTNNSCHATQSTRTQSGPRMGNTLPVAARGGRELTLRRPRVHDQEPAKADPGLTPPTKSMITVRMRLVVTILV